MRRILLTVLIALVIPAISSAQDTNYWDTQYGTKGQMLGGMVVGYPSDLSATFYNPGWIALDVDGTFLLTTEAVEYYSIKLYDALGDGIDIDSNTVETSPSYLAGRFTTDLARTWSWAYSYLQRVKFNLNPRGVQFDPSMLPPAEGAWFSGEALRQAKTNEYWYGVSAARKIKKKVALGISPYVVYRSTDSRTQSAAQSVQSDGAFAQTYLADQYKFWNARLLAKIGLAFDHDVVKMGLTLTTPSLGILGSGETMNQFTLSGADLDNDGTIEPPNNANNYQEGLSTNWKSPLSIAFGATWKPGSTGIHTTMEWFNSVSVRNAMDPEPFIDQTTGGTVTTTIAYAASQVFNYGIGVEHDFNDDFAAYLAFRSDYTSAPDDGSNDLALSSWNLWHISGGTSFQFLNMEFNTGIQYSWGASDSARFINFNPEEGEALLTDPGIFKMSYSRIKVLIGFNLPAMGVTTPDSEVAP
jgi:hypothetical protein